ncbi:hypothetical protein Tco_1509249 [Tanacetum coccineum]
MSRYDINTLAKKFEKILKEVVPMMVNNTTNQNIKDNPPLLVVEGIRLEREKTKADIASMVADAVRNEQECTRAVFSSQVSNDIDTNIPPQQLYLKMRDDEQARNADFPLWLTLMYKFEKPSSHVEPCIVDAFHKQDHEGHHDDDAHPEGESSAKRKRTSEKVSSLKASLITRRMLPNTSLILELFCKKFKKLIYHFTEMITLKLLV